MQEVDHLLGRFHQLGVLVQNEPNFAPRVAFPCHLRPPARLERITGVPIDDCKSFSLPTI